MKKLILIGVCIFGIYISGCTWHENPLLQKDTDKSEIGKQLALAEEYAFHKIFGEDATPYRLYGNCMTGKEPNKNQCKTIYQYMRQYFSKQDDYKNVTLADLTDPKVYQTLKTYYHDAAFNEI